MRFNRYSGLIALGGALAAGRALADGAGAAEALNQVGEIFGQGLTLGLTFIAAAVFLIAAYGVVVKIIAAVNGRGTWGEVMMPFVVGAAAVVLIGWLVTGGTTAVGQIGTGGAG